MISKITSLYLLAFLLGFNGEVNGQDSSEDWLLFEYEAVALENKLVRTELELSDSQAKKLKGLLLDTVGKLRFYKKRLQGSDEGSREYRSVLEDGNRIVEESRTKFQDVALEFQQKRLSQIARQMRFFGTNGVNLKVLKIEFEISNKQEDEISDLNDEFSAELKELKESYEKKMEELFKKQYRKYKNELGRDQQKEFEDLFGSPFIPLGRNLINR